MTSDRRRTETPNATMTTLASPTLGPTSRLSLWTVAMEAGASGPMHRFDSEQIWTVLDGELSVRIDDATIAVTAGDAVVLPAGAPRQVTATTAAHAVACGYGDAIVNVPGEDGDRGTPPWIA